MFRLSAAFVKRANDCVAAAVCLATVGDGVVLDEATDTPLFSVPTSDAKLPITFPAGWYSHTTYQPWLEPQKAVPHPTCVVSFQTSCVKWPVSSLKLGLAQLYRKRSSPQAWVASWVLA